MTCPEPIIPRLLPIIERFHACYPQVRVEFVTSDRYLDLTKGEADVALRSGDTEDELVGRKIADSIGRCTRAMPTSACTASRRDLRTWTITASSAWTNP